MFCIFYDCLNDLIISSKAEGELAGTRPTNDALVLSDKMYVLRLYTPVPQISVILGLGMGILLMGTHEGMEGRKKSAGKKNRVEM